VPPRGHAGFSLVATRYYHGRVPHDPRHRLPSRAHHYRRARESDVSLALLAGLQDAPRRLQDAARRGVKTTLVYGKSTLNPEEEAALSQIDGPSVYFLENLHTKC
jgi:hypothetical protein